jgi:hypothetical protein
LIVGLLLGALASSAPSAWAAGTSTPKSELLAKADLPSGWKDDGATPTTGGTGSGCGEVEPTVAQTHPSASAGATYTKGQNLGVEELIYAYATDDTAKAAWTLIDAQLNGCRSYTQDGAKVTAAATPFPSFGDRSGAWRLVANESGQKATDVPVVVLDGSQLVFVAYADAGIPTVAQVKPFVAKAVARLG